MMLGVTNASVLWLLPLALLPLTLRLQRTVGYSWLHPIAADGLSAFANVALRVAGAAVIVLIVLGVSGLFRPAQPIERIGEGAEIVLLLDRSRSMDEPFAGEPFTNPLARSGYRSKGTIARELLAQFAARRRSDRFGMIMFSTEPIQTLPLTDKPALIQAAISAGNIGKALAQTNIGGGLLKALEFFEGRPYTGSRVVMLISDGGAQLDLATRTRIQNQFKRQRAALYWIYVRSRNSPGIVTPTARPANAATAPARSLHEFFSKMDVPYRAYDAEDPQALARAIEAVSRLQSLPIRYVDVVPRRDLAGWCYGLAAVFLVMLLGAKLMEVRTWP